MNGYGNPYGYPYNPGYQQQMYGQQMPQRYELVKVSGRGGVDALRVAPRSELLAMDTSRTDVLLAWYIQADDAGYKSVTPYVLTPYTDPAPIDTANIEQRLKRLEEIIDGKSVAGKPTKADRAAAARQPVADAGGV